jgi:hypothetical protein
VATAAFNVTKSFSHVEIALPSGEYRLKITNFTVGFIEYATVKTKEGKEIILLV